MSRWTYSDAWNRLVKVFDPDISETYPVLINEFDGLNRRIVKQSDPGGDNSIDATYDYYYNNQWQVLEIHLDGDSTYPWKQYVYHPYYIDAILMRFYDSDTDGTLAGDMDTGAENDGEHYYLQDANFNVTAVAENNGTVVERYNYTPYGEVTVLNADFTLDSSGGGDGLSDIDNEYLYTGRRRDPETGLQLNRNRFYAAHLGRWVNRDPIGYWGGASLYAYVLGMPTYYVDPSGLRGASTTGPARPAPTFPGRRTGRPDRRQNPTRWPTTTNPIRGGGIRQPPRTDDLGEFMREAYGGYQYHSFDAYVDRSIWREEYRQQEMSKYSGSCTISAIRPPTNEEYQEMRDILDDEVRTENWKQSRCSLARLARLNLLIKFHCKTVKRSCPNGLNPDNVKDCRILMFRHKANRDCQKWRSIRENECFDGGDQDHRNAIKDVQRNINDCGAKIRSSPKCFNMFLEQQFEQQFLENLGF
jgi:RHS repeat-associated protein